MVTAKLLDKFQSPKIIFLPSGLDLDDAPQGFQWKGCGFLMAGNGSASTVRVSIPLRVPTKNVSGREQFAGRCRQVTIRSLRSPIVLVPNW